MTRPLSVAQVQARYDRAARWFDLAETPLDLLLFRALRRCCNVRH